MYSDRLNYPTHTIRINTRALQWILASFSSFFNLFSTTRPLHIERNSITRTHTILYFFFLLQARLVVVITFSFSHTQFLWLSFSCQRFASSQKLRFSMLQVTEIHRFSDTQNNDCSDLHTDERPKMSKKIFTLQHWVFPCELFSRALCDVTTQSRAEEKTVYFPFPKPVFHH